MKYKCWLLLSVVVVGACAAEGSKGMSEADSVAAENRLAEADGIPVVASGKCGPFDVLVHASEYYNMNAQNLRIGGELVDLSSQGDWTFSTTPRYFSGIAVKIIRPDSLNSIGLSYRYVPIRSSERLISKRVEWLSPDREWVDVFSPFNFITTHGEQEITWREIGKDLPSDQEIQSGTPYEAFWENQFVYSLPYNEILNHQSREYQPGDRFRLVEPHPVQLRWQGEICTIPVPNVEFRVTGREES